MALQCANKIKSEHTRNPIRLEAEMEHFLNFQGDESSRDEK